MQHTVIDLLIGSFSSCVNSLVGYPLDFIKTRMQINDIKHGAIKQGLHIIKHEGFLTLYRGLSAQMTGLMISGSLYFSTYEHVRRKFSQYSNQHHQDYLANYQIFISGSMAGLVGSAVSVPFEYLKVLSQRELPNEQGPFKNMATIFQNQGVIKLYKGSHLQFTRDLIGCGFFFLSQNITLQYFTPEGKTRNEASQLGILLSSIAAGSTYWTISYPIDIIKTRFQVSNLGTMAVIKDIYQTGGTLHFYKGFKITLTRSILVNSFALPVYENCRRIAYNSL